MKELTMFGMAVAFDEGDNRLVPQKENISYEDYSRKYSGGMLGLLADPDYRVEDAPYYDFYKAIVENEQRGCFAQANLRFDSTVIMAGDAGGEYKKTAGHFHCTVPGQSVSYPELYQVIKGKALFVMQKVDDCRKDGQMVVEDAILAEVHAGEAVVIPPDYGHCTINISDETMVFINLVSLGSNNYYESVKASRGMCCYAMKDHEGYRIEKNPRYIFACEPRIVRASDSGQLGIRKGIPAYTAFLKDSGKFRYLDDPAGFNVDYFTALQGTP